MDAMRANPIERWSLAAACLLALAGAAWLAASLPWPSGAGPGEFPMVAAWQKLVAPFPDARLRGLLPALVAADAALAASIALALIWRPAAWKEARFLSCALALGALSVVYLFQARLHFVQEMPLKAVIDAVAFALGGASVANLCAFLFAYPHPPTLAQLTALAQRNHGRSNATIRRWLDVRVVSTWMRLGQAFARPLPRRLVSACAGALGLALPLTNGAGTAATLLFIACAAVPVVLCGFAFVWLQAKYQAGDAQDRRRIGWIYLGPAAGFAAVALALFALLAGSTLAPTDDLLLWGAPLIAWSVAAWFCVTPVLVACFLLGLAFSIYYAGTLDPEHAIRRSLMAGLGGTVLTLAFVMLENLASSELAARIGLSGQASTLAAATAAALLLAPLRSRLDRLVNRWMERLMPEPGDAPDAGGGNDGGEAA